MRKLFIMLLSVSFLTLLSCDSLFSGLGDGLIPGMQTEQDFDVEMSGSSIIIFYKIEFKDASGNVIGECVTTLNPTDSSPVSTVVNMDLGNVFSIVVHSFLGSVEFPVGDIISNVLNALPGGSPMISMHINPLDLVLKKEACLKIYMRKNTNVPFEQDTGATLLYGGDALCISASDLGLPF